jgi:hypothetical protein
MIMSKKWSLILLLFFGVFYNCMISYGDIISQKIIAKIDKPSWIYDSFQASSDGNHYAYVIEVGGKKSVVIDGNESQRYDDLSTPVFSFDGEHIAYAVKNGLGWSVITDGKIDKNIYSEILGNSLIFTTDNKHLAYSAKLEGKWHLVVDGVSKGQYDYIANIKASINNPDSFRCLALKGDIVYLIEEKADSVQLDEATRQKLQALESAHDAGILNDEEYQRKKAELMGQSSQITPAVTANLPVKRQGKTYNNAKGLSFWYPNDWTVKEDDGNIQVVPPNPATSGDTPVELYYVIMESIADASIQRPDDPQIVEYLSEQLKPLSPNLKRVGEAKPVKTDSGSGVILDWEVSSPTGEVVMARAFVSIINEQALMLVGMGAKNSIVLRDPILGQIFASFAIGKPQPSVGSSQPTASAELASGEVGDPNWGFKFKPPDGWKFQKNGSGAILGHDTIAGMIIIMTHMAGNLQEVQDQLQKGLQEEGIQLSLTGTLQPLGDNILAGDYEGIANGQQVKARGFGTLSPYGGGAFIIAVTIPEKYGSPLTTPAEAIAKSMQYFKVEASELMQHFAGTWVNSTTNTETQMTLAPDGSYFENYEASYSGGFSNQYGSDLGGWGTARQDQGQGRWTVRGDRQQGSIIITKKDGGQIVLEYKVHVENGETYWKEYWFNGKLYGKK